MLAHPIRKLLDLAQAARHIQEEASADNINTFEMLMAQMVDFEAQSTGWKESSDIPVIAHLPMIRGETRTKNGLSIGGSIVFELEDLDLTISIYRENVVGSLKLQCDVNNHEWIHAAALLNQSGMLIDTSWVDRDGEFTLTALTFGEAYIKLRSVTGRQIILDPIEIEP